MGNTIAGQLWLRYRWRYRCAIADAIASEIIGIYHWCYDSYSLLAVLFNCCAIVGAITGAITALSLMALSLLALSLLALWLALCLALTLHSTTA